MQPFGGILAVRIEGHLVFADVIEDASQFHGMPFVFEVLDRISDEIYEVLVKIEILRLCSFGCPVIHLRATVSELGEGNVAGNLTLQRAGKTQFWAEGIVGAGRTKRFPSAG